MKRDYRIVVLNIHGHWSASFENSPERGYGGATAREAAKRLIKACEQIDLENEQAVELEAAEGEARLDLIVRVS